MFSYCHYLGLFFTLPCVVYCCRAYLGRQDPDILFFLLFFCASRPLVGFPILHRILDKKQKETVMFVVGFYLIAI